MTNDTQAVVEKLSKLHIADGDVIVVHGLRGDEAEYLWKGFKEAGIRNTSVVFLQKGQTIEAIPSSDLFRLLEKRFVPESTTDEELTGPRKDPYVSVNFMRDTETKGSWLVLFFPDETVVRLRMTEREANEFALAVVSGGGSMKVKV